MITVDYINPEGHNTARVFTSYTEAKAFAKSHVDKNRSACLYAGNDDEPFEAYFLDTETGYICRKTC